MDHHRDTKDTKEDGRVSLSFSSLLGVLGVLVVVFSSPPSE